MVQRGDPINYIAVGTVEDGNPLKKKNVEIIQNITSNERSQNEFHEHHKTRRKGFNEHDGCRLANQEVVPVHTVYSLIQYWKKIMMMA